MNTEIEIPVASLKSVLPGLSKIIPKSSSLPLLQCVRVSLDPEHRLRLGATNLEESVSVSLGPCPSGVPGELLVPLDELVLLNKNCLAGDSIRLIGTDSETHVSYPVAGHPVERPLTRFELKEWPQPSMPSKEPIALEESFKLALREAFECASSDASRHVLNGVCLDVKSQEAHYVVATDGSHLYCANSFLFDLPVSLIVPTRRFPGWLGFVNDGPWKLRFDPPAGDKPGLFGLESDHWSYVARPIPEEYPNWKQVVPTEDNRTRIVLEEAGVQTILDALPLLPGMDRHNEPITMAVEVDGFCLKGTGDGHSWTRIPIAGARVQGRPTDVTLNRSFLSKALRFGLNQIDIADDLTPVLFLGNGKQIVAMPLRSETPQQPTEETPVAPPSAPEAVQPAEETERKPVSENLTVPPRGNLNPSEDHCAIKEIIERIEGIKTSLREVLSELNQTLPLLKEAIKDQKATEKEIASVRSTLRSLQKVEF